MTSTTSWQLIAVPSAIDVPLERGAHARARAVEQHALVDLGDVERRAHLLGAVALDVAHADDGLLRQRQVGDGAHRHAYRLAILDELVGCLPVGREGAPAAGVLLVRAAEALGVDGGGVVARSERGEGDGARLARAARLGLVDE